MPRRRALRSDPAGRDAAGRRRARVPRPQPRPPGNPGDRADRPRQRLRQGGRARSGGGRLHHQAVRLFRAGGPLPGRAAPPRRLRAQRDRARPRDFRSALGHAAARRGGGGAAQPREPAAGGLCPPPRAGPLQIPADGQAVFLRRRGDGERDRGLCRPPAPPDRRHRPADRDGARPRLPDRDGSAVIGTASIGRRLTLLLAGVAALLSLMSWSMVASLARQAAERTQDNVLAASATAIAETLRSEQGEVRLELPYSAFSMLGAIGEDRVFYRVMAGARMLTGYEDLPVPTAAAAPAAPGRVIFDTGEFGGEAIRLASITRVVLAGAQPVPVIVTVAQTREGVAAIASDLSRLAAILSVAFFAVAVALSAVAARASLRPLNEIAAAVSRRGPSDLRPLRRAAPTELAPLMTSLNRLMDRLGQSIRSAEDFIAEAAHRIRTPLATVRAQAEIALRSARNDEQKQRLRQMIRAVDESSRSAGQLLDHAMV